MQTPVCIHSYTPACADVHTDACIYIYTRMHIHQSMLMYSLIPHSSVQMHRHVTCTLMHTQTPAHTQIHIDTHTVLTLTCTHAHTSMLGPQAAVSGLTLVSEHHIRLLEPHMNSHAPVLLRRSACFSLPSCGRPSNCRGSLLRTFRSIQP